jgi:putative ATP-binding cassette transporter
VLDDSERDAYRELFAAVFSDYFLFRELVGIESINTDRVATLLAELDLTDKVTLADGGFSTIELSAGQRKRLAYVVAMLDDRPVLVLDEFGAEQDPQHRHRFYRDLLPRLRASGKTVVVVSHDDAYFDCADRIIKMDFGGIVDQTINAKDQRQRGSR